MDGRATSVALGRDALAPARQARLRADGFLDTWRRASPASSSRSLTAASVRKAFVELRALALPSGPIVAHAETYGIALFRKALVFKGEMLALANGTFTHRRPVEVAASRDHLTRLRETLSFLTVLALVLTVLAGPAAMMDHPSLFAVAGSLGVVTAVLVRLLRDLRSGSPD